MSGTLAVDVDKMVTDGKGRVLQVRSLSPLEEMDLMETAGADAAANRRWMITAELYACVRAIDGKPRPFPTTRPMLRAHIEAVGAAGLNAVVEAVNDAAALLTEGNGQAEVELAKN